MRAISTTGMVGLLGIALAMPTFAGPNGRWTVEQYQGAGLSGLVYANSATASSEYGTSWGASTATGAPDVFPRFGDLQQTWAPQKSDSTEDWLEVAFPATAAGKLLVFETNAPGALRKVVDLSSGETVLWETQEKPQAYTAAQVFWLDLGGRNVSRLRLVFNPSLVAGWPEVDAVALVPGGAASGRWTPAEYQAANLTGLVFATGSSASSSYSQGWDAPAAMGAPDVFPRHGDLRGAWAPQSSSSTDDWLEVTFPTTNASTLLVFETNSPGALRTITAGESVVYESKDTPQALSEARVLFVDLGGRSVDRVRITVNASLVSGWPEIDAVALVPGSATSSGGSSKTDGSSKTGGETGQSSGKGGAVPDLYRKSGRSWLIKNVTNAGGTEMVTYMETVVVSSTDTSATIQTTILNADRSVLMKNEPTVITFQATGGTSTVGPVATPEMVDETITVAAGTFECLRVEVSGATSWTSKKFPGLLIKTTHQAGMSELVEFKE